MIEAAQAKVLAANLPGPDTVLEVIPEDDTYDRTKYIGGSNVGAVMGVGAYEQTPLSVYMVKTGQSLEAMDETTKLFLARRKRWEGPIIEMLREEFDAEIVAINKRYRDSQFPYLACELDFEWRDNDGRIQDGEIKTVSPFAFGDRGGWGEAGTDEIPIHYAAQVMHGLGMTGRSVCIVAAMVGLDNMVFYRVERDDATIAEMRERCILFWENNVLARIPPEPISMQDIVRLTTKMRGKPVEINNDIKAKLDQLINIRASKKGIEFAEEEIGFEVFNFVRKAWGEPVTEVADLSPDNAVLMYDGKKYATWNRQRGVWLDQKRLKEEKPELVKAYQKENFFRVLRIAKR